MSMLTREIMKEWLNETDPRKLEDLYRRAYEEKLRCVGSKVHFRGIIEFSNLCSKNCEYCGIRKDNQKLQRFLMSEEEILECAQTAYDMDYGSIVLQSGERQDEEFVSFVEDVIRKIKDRTSQELGVTLSLGEQRTETYKRWFHAGAHRYLLRIETSNRELYRKLHPEDHFFEIRLDCLRTLRRIGYQTGTGVMIGLPFQTVDDLVDDIFFFKEEDVDMIGMGPYIPHENTPLSWPEGGYDASEHFRRGLVMIALTRLTLQDVNIAAATALQALHPSGRELGVSAGANIIMPNITPTRFRGLYKLYDNKPCLDENARQCRSCLEKRLLASGHEIGYKEWGDSPHFSKRRTNQKS